MTTLNAATNEYVLWCEDLAAIVLRAEALGFSRHRVAAALRIDPRDLTAIERPAQHATNSRADDGRTSFAPY